MQSPAAGMTALPWDYRWSSARAHVLGAPHPLLTPCPRDSIIVPGPAWGAWLLEQEDDALFARLRANTYTGWPTGSPEFLTELETRLGRRLQRQTAGRKRKESGNT